jgi:hypothetical protein
LFVWASCFSGPEAVKKSKQTPPKLVMPQLSVTHTSNQKWTQGGRHVVEDDIILMFPDVQQQRWMKVL